MCVHMIVFYLHTVSNRAGRTWLRGAVYAKKYYYQEDNTDLQIHTDGTG